MKIKSMYNMVILISFLIYDLLLQPLIRSKSACAEEIWPPQPDIPALQSIPTFMPQPIYPRGRVFELPYEAYFFHSRVNLDEYTNHKDVLSNERKKQILVVLPKGHELTALETFKAFRGRVFDKKLGNGYVIIFSRF